MNRAIVVLSLVLAVPAIDAAAHGEAKALRGGVVQVVEDVQFELVPQPKGAALYVSDHGKATDVSAMSGRLTVLSGTRKSVADLKPADGNRLEASGLTVAPGSKVIASVKGPGERETTVRFSVK